MRGKGISNLSAARTPYSLLLPTLLILLILAPGCGGGPEPVARSAIDRGTRTTFEEARRLIGAGEPTRARRLLEDLASPVQPASVRGEARLALGRCALMEGNSDEALTHLQQAFALLRRHPLRPTAELLLGEACLRCKAYTLAVNHLIGAYRFLAADKDQVRAAFLITKILESTDQPVPERYSLRSQGASFPEYDSIWRRLKPPPIETVPVVARVQKPETRTPAPQMIRRVSRKVWGAGSVIMSRTLPLGNPAWITIHHTADQSEMLELAGRNTREYLRRLQSHYQKNRKYADLPYHFIISSDGRIWDGREISYQGAHAGNNTLNKGNIGIALVGDFDRQRLSRQQSQSLRVLIRDLCSRFQIPARGVFGHGELKSTDCPGKNLRRLMPQFTRQLESDLRKK